MTHTDAAAAHSETFVEVREFTPGKGDGQPTLHVHVLRSCTFIHVTDSDGETRGFEVDRAEWFDTDTARLKLVKGQIVFLDRLITLLNRGSGG